MWLSVHASGTPDDPRFTRLTEPDNTNADPNTRAVWVALAQKLKVPLRCVLFTASPKLCEHNDTFRALNVGPEVSCMAANPFRSSWCERLFQTTRRLVEELS